MTIKQLFITIFCCTLVATACSNSTSNQTQEKEPITVGKYYAQNNACPITIEITANKAFTITTQGNTTHAGKYEVASKEGNLLHINFDDIPAQFHNDTIVIQNRENATSKNTRFEICTEKTIYFTKKKQQQKKGVYSEIIKSIEKDDQTAFDGLIKQVSKIDSLLHEPNSEDSYTLLGYACKYKRCDIAKKLIELKADIDTVKEDGYFGYDALNVAIEAQDVCLVKLLLKKGANPNRWYNEEGFSALSLSCKLNNYEITRILLNKKAKVNGVGTKGTNYVHYPVLYAVENDNVQMVQLLLEKGCNLNVRNKQGDTPISIAKRKQNKRMLELLTERG